MTHCGLHKVFVTIFIQVNIVYFRPMNWDIMYCKDKKKQTKD